MFPHKYLMLPIFFYSFAILIDVNGAMLTAGWNQIVVAAQI
jgi:hypothetical protein